MPAYKPKTQPPGPFAQAVNKEIAAQKFEDFKKAVSELRTTIEIVSDDPRLDPAARTELNIQKARLGAGEKRLARQIESKPEKAMEAIKAKEDALEGTRKEVGGVLEAELRRAGDDVLEKVGKLKERENYLETTRKMIERKADLGWIFGEAKKTKAYIVDEVPKVLESKPSERRLANVLSEALEFGTRLDELAGLLEYTGPEPRKETITLAYFVADWLSKSAGQHIGDEMRRFAEYWSKEGWAQDKTPIDAAKAMDIAYQIGYAADRLRGGPSLDSRKIPKAHRERVEGFEYAIKAKLNDGFLDRKLCFEAADVLINARLMQDADIVRLYYAFGLKDPALVEKVGEFVKATTHIAEIRKQALKASPIRAYSSLRMLIGTASEYESLKLKAETPRRKLEEARLAYLDYLVLKMKSILQFELARKETLDLISAYGAHLTTPQRKALRGLAITDPYTGEPVLVEGTEESYFESIKKTIWRWNDLGKDFRKLPYNFEKAVREKFRQASKEEINDLLSSAESDFEARLLRIGEHVDNGKKLYHSAMKLREEKLPALPVKEKAHSPYFDPFSGNSAESSETLPKQ